MSASFRSAALLSAFLLATVGGGLWIGVSNPPGVWYESLVKPGFTPPDRLFPAAWTVLYALVAIAGWRVFQDGPTGARILWIAQIALNFSWSPTFFGAHRIDLGLGVLALLLAAILAFLAATARRNRAAFLCFLPYSAWVAYAAALNLSIMASN